MPEESFEQQARRRAEEFSMEPTPDVWLHVKAAVTPEERRRRILIWWWLLPLCLAGGVGFWLAGNRQNASGGKTVAVVVNEKKFTIQPLPVHLEEKKIRVEKETDKQEKQRLEKVSQPQSNIVLSEKFEKAKKEFLISSPGSSTTSKAKIEKMTVSEAETDIVKREEESNVVMNKEVETSSHTAAMRLSIGESSAVAGDSLAAESDSLLTEEETKTDTTSVAKNFALAGKATDSANEKKKQPKKKSWQIGAMAEIGVVSWTKGLLNGEKSISNVVPSLSLADFTIDSLAKAGNTVYQTKNGVSMGVGIVMRKNVSRRFYFTTQLSYRYQQYRVYQFLNVPIPQTTLNSGSYLIGLNDYYSHFLNLGVNAGAKLLTGKRNALSVEAGIDNGFLFTAQKKDDTQTGAFRLGGNITANFYRWQPQVSLALPFNWHKEDNVKFQVSPFARFGLHTFQKDGNSYKDNHLVSVGVQAVYFFK